MTDYDMSDPIFYAAYGEAKRDPMVQSILQRHKSFKDATLDPEFNAAFDAAFESAHNAITADPFEHQRAEAIRLRDKVQSEYRKTGLAWRYLGEAFPSLDSGVYSISSGYWTGDKIEPDGIAAVSSGVCGINGMGYWTGDKKMPNDIAAVSSLVQCLTLIDRSPTESGRMLMAKRLIVLLQQAQKACNEIPEPSAFCLLSKHQKAIMLVMYLEGAMDALNGLGIKKILDLLGDIDLYPAEKTVQRALADMREKGLAEKEGPSNQLTIYLLTREGAGIGEYLGNRKRCPMMYR